MATEMTAPVRLRPSTVERIKALKVYPRETMDDTVARLLDEREKREGEAPK